MLEPIRKIFAVIPLVFSRKFRTFAAKLTSDEDNEQAERFRQRKRCFCNFHAVQRREQMRQVRVAEQQIVQGRTVFSRRKTRRIAGIFPSSKQDNIRVCNSGRFQRSATLTFLCFKFFVATEPHSAAVKNSFPVAELYFRMFAQNVVQILD